MTLTSGRTKAPDHINQWANRWPVKNLSYNLLKTGRVSEDITQYESLLHVDEGDTAIDRMILAKAFAILEFEERQIVILHALTGMKHREIAELLDVPIGTVLSKHNRSLAKMKKEIEGKGVE